MTILAQLLNVPDDIDSLVQAAFGAAGADGQAEASRNEPIASVLYTIHSNDLDPGGPQIMVEAEVVHDAKFEGSPSLQIRLAHNESQSGSVASGPSGRPPTTGGRSLLGYRPAWTPALVREPAALAEQMRVRWFDALAELKDGVDPRMATFLALFQGMDSALAVLTSAHSPASKFVVLQGLLDPDGLIQYKGLGLDAATFVDQIRAADGGDEEALSWLEDIQREQVLTSLAEVTGTNAAAEADFHLTRWSLQGAALIKAVTTKTKNAEFEFSEIRSILRMQADLSRRVEQRRARIAEMKASNPESAERLNSMLGYESRRPSPGTDPEYGILEDYFFEETRIYLQARFRQSLPGQFAAALIASSNAGASDVAFAAAVRAMAAASSTDPKDYSADGISTPSPWHDALAKSLGISQRRYRSGDRIERILQAVKGVTQAVKAAGDDDLGTLVVAHEVLCYAQWKRDEFRASKQAEKVEQHKADAIERSRKAKQRAEASRLRDEQAQEVRSAVWDVDDAVRRYAQTLEHTIRSIRVENPFPESHLAAAKDRLEKALAKKAAADGWLAAADERALWAVAEVKVAATSSVEELLLAERDEAVAEQSEAKSEQQAAQRERDAAERDVTDLAAARYKFDKLIQPVLAENERRLEAETRHKQEQEEKRRQAEELRKKQEAAVRRQEELNQRQQERASVAKHALGMEIDRLIALPTSASIWRRKRLAATRVSLEQAILKLQAEITAPNIPPRTHWKTWPSMLSANDRYLGTVKKIMDYGAFVSLPAGVDGLIRFTGAGASLHRGQMIIVEIVAMPSGKPFVLRQVAPRA
ncbi:hypothetical protein [Arthrobacter sp. 3Tela_A]|uniref:hypothetical protein n=1 Tax=Arthrobacter sp. 3Tela_A TaxID=3093743 RepID=UPI003BB58BCE